MLTPNPTPDAYRDLPVLGAAPAQLSRFEGLSLFMPFPYFHSACLSFALGAVIYCDMTLLCPPMKPLTADLADLYHQYAGCDISMLPSSIHSDILANAKAYENLGKVRYLGYGGSQLSSNLGEPLSKKAHLFSFLGLTEACTLPFQITAPEDWQYLQFEPATGCQFQQTENGEYEMVLVRTSKTEMVQGVFTTYPKLANFPTADLYSKHPLKSNHWLYEGRADDIIIFSNGEKLNPLSLEQSIETHPGVKGAVTFGAGRFQPGLLLETDTQGLGSDIEGKYLESVWPTVEHENINTVAHGRISKNMIFLTKPDKPLLRTAKGSVRRKLSLDLYSQEIDLLYEKVAATSNAGTSSGTSSTLDLSSRGTILPTLSNAVEEQTGWKPEQDDQDLFSSGLDSLQTSNLAREINSTYGMDASVEPKDVYSHPTIGSLADMICEKCGIKSEPSSDKSRSERMQEVFQHFSADLPITARHASSPDGVCVILTGSTGSLGSYLLDSLMARGDVGHIYCLNRSSNALKRQMDIGKERGLSTDFNARVEFLRADFSKPFFGLSLVEYRKLLNSVTHILHNAWPVNFNLSLESFTDTHINGVRQLIDFSSRSSFAARIYFLSTIGTIQRREAETSEQDRDSTTRAPEKIFDDWNVSQTMGYAESKQISEVLLDTAARICDQNTTVCRLGQIAGPVLRGRKGVWAKQEW